MKLWLLRPVEDLPLSDNPWEPWYDKCFGFVVRSDTEHGAREYAQAGAGDERRWEFMRKQTARTTTPWLDPKYSTCVELTADGDAGIVMQDFHAA